MSRLVAETFKHMGVAAWKVPDVARFKVVRLRLTSRVNHSCADPAFENKRPFGGRSVPMKLSHHSGLELHCYTGDSLRDGKLVDGRFLAKAVSHYFSGGFLQFEFKSRQFFSGK